MRRRINRACRGSKPQRDDYEDESESGSEKGQNSDDDDLDNEGKNGLYWIDLMEYEQTQLRKTYAARMQQLHPAWDVEVKESLLKQDIMWAINLCGESMCLRNIEEWVDHVEKGDFRKLGDVINPPLL